MSKFHGSRCICPSCSELRGTNNIAERDKLLALLREAREAIEMGQMYALGDVCERNESMDRIMARIDAVLEKKA